MNTSRLPILLLAAAGFTILTTEFLIVGLLPAVAREFKVEVSQAGLLVTLFALTVAVTGPFMTAWLSGIERKRLFVSVLIIFGFANLLAAASPNIGVMALARFIPALALPVFWSLASETAVDLVEPERAGSAISTVAFGIVAATILGIPIGTMISDAFGWRSAFIVIAVLSFAKALLLYARFPTTRVDKERVPMGEQMRALRSPVVVGHVLLSILVFAGMFTAYTYLADILERLAGLSGAAVGWCLMGFGAVGLFGNWLGGKLADKGTLGWTVMFCAPMALGMLVLVPVIQSFGLTALILGVWGISQAALLVLCHARLMKATPGAAAFGASLNISGANFGISMGALIGSRTIDGFGLASVGQAAAIIVVLAIGTALLLRSVSAPKPVACNTAA